MRLVVQLHSQHDIRACGEFNGRVEGDLRKAPAALCRFHHCSFSLIRVIRNYDSGFGAKPAAGPVLAFARAIDVGAHEVAVVGDSIEDLVAARAAGAVAIGVRSGPTPGELLAPYADALIDSIADLPAWLAGVESSAR